MFHISYHVFSPYLLHFFTTMFNYQILSESSLHTGSPIQHNHQCILMQQPSTLCLPPHHRHRVQIIGSLVCPEGPDALRNQVSFKACLLLLHQCSACSRWAQLLEMYSSRLLVCPWALLSLIFSASMYFFEPRSKQFMSYNRLSLYRYITPPKLQGHECNILA